MEFPSSRTGTRTLAFVIKLDGDFDLSDYDRLRDAFAIPSSANLVAIDLRTTSYVDSSVLKCLVELRRRTIDRGAQFVLVGLMPSVKRILEICHFDELFDIRENFGELSPSAFGTDDVRMLTLISRIGDTDS